MSFPLGHHPSGVTSNPVVVVTVPIVVVVLATAHSA